MLRRIAVRVSLFAGSLFVGLLLGELAVRIVLPQYLAVRTDRAMWQYDETLGWVTRPDIEVEQGFGDLNRVPVRINRHGFRDDERSLEPNGRRRVLMLGDSFAFGFGVRVEDRHTEIAERLRPDLDFVNLGVSGYATDQELLLFRREGARYAADVVVLVYVSNDPWANARPLGHGHPKPRFEIVGDELQLRNVPVPRSRRALRIKYALIRGSALFNLLHQLYERAAWSRLTSAAAGAGQPVGSALPLDSTITRRLILTLAREVEQTGAEFLVLLAISTANLDRNIAGNLRLLEWCHDRGLVCVDTYPDFREQAEQHPEIPLFIEDRQHWSAAGHRVVAKRLLRSLSALGWIDSQPESGLSASSP